MSSSSRTTRACGSFIVTSCTTWTPGWTAKVYVVNEESQDVWVLNARTHAVLAKIKAGELPHGIAASPDGKALYVTNMGSNDITIINTLTDTGTIMHGAGLNPHESAVS